jgi:hypothetical protein
MRAQPVVSYVVYSNRRWPVSITAACAMGVVAARLPTATVSPSPWILLARFPDIAVYIDSTRIERVRPDTSVGVWLLWISDTPMQTSSPPSGDSVKRITVHAGVRCQQGRVRALATDVYNPTGTRVGHHDFTPADSLAPTFDAMVHNVLPAVCAWLRDPTTPAVIVR